MFDNKWLDYTHTHGLYDVWGSTCWCIENTHVSSFERNIRDTKQGVKSEGEKIILLKCRPLFVGLSSFSATMSMIRNEQFAFYSGLQYFLQNNFLEFDYTWGTWMCLEEQSMVK